MNNNTFQEVWRSFINVSKKLFETHKWMYLFFIYIAWLIIEAFSNSESGMIFILCTIISIVSIGIYGNTKSYSETALSFILGLFTVFSTTWDSKLFMIFISFYLLFNIVTFMISSIRLAAKQEMIITQAAVKYRNRNYDEVFKTLKKISDKSSKNGQLGPIEKAEIIRFLSYRKIEIEYLSEAINVVELIRTVQQCELSEALTLFYNLYVLDVISGGNEFSGDRIIRMMDEIVVLPVSHEEFYYLFNKLKKKVMRKEITFINLMRKIKEYAYKGMDVEEIVQELNN